MPSGYFPRWWIISRLSQLSRLSPSDGYHAKTPYSAGADPGFWNGGWIVSTSIREIREIKYYMYFNIWGIRKKKERRGLRKRGVKIHPFHLPWICACSGDIISESTSLPWGYVSQSNSSGLPDPSGLALIIYMRHNGAIDIRKLTGKQLRVWRQCQGQWQRICKDL